MQQLHMKKAPAQMAVYTHKGRHHQKYVCVHTHMLQGLMTSVCVCAHRHAPHVLPCKIERLNTACSRDVGEKLITGSEYGDGRDWRRGAGREITMGT